MARRNESEYIFADAYICSYMKDLMTKSDLIRLANCPDFDSAESLLRDFCSKLSFAISIYTLVFPEPVIPNKILVVCCESEIFFIALAWSFVSEYFLCTRTGLYFVSKYFRRVTSRG